MLRKLSRRSVLHERAEEICPRSNFTCVLQLRRQDLPEDMLSGLPGFQTYPSDLGDQAHIALRV